MSAPPQPTLLPPPTALDVTTAKHVISTLKGREDRIRTLWCAVDVMGSSSNQEVVSIANLVTTMLAEETEALDRLARLLDFVDIRATPELLLEEPGLASRVDGTELSGRNAALVASVQRLAAVADRLGRSR